MSEPFVRVTPSGDAPTTQEFVEAQRRLEKALDGKADVVRTLPNLHLVVNVQNRVLHGLNRKYAGWRVIDSTAPATVWRDTTATSDLDLCLTLLTSATTTVTLEVW